MDTKPNKVLKVSLEELDFPKSSIGDSVLFNDADTINLLIMSGVTKYSLGSKTNLSEYFSNYSEYREYFKSLGNELSIPIYYDSEFDYLSLDYSDSIIIPDEMTVVDFFETLRNSVAHRNILYFKNTYILFMSYVKKYNSKSIDRAWKEKTKFLIFLNKIDDISKICNHLFSYINKQDKK